MLDVKNINIYYGHKEIISEMHHSQFLQVKLWGLLGQMVQVRQPL